MFHNPTNSTILWLHNRPHIIVKCLMTWETFKVNIIFLSFKNTFLINKNLLNIRGMVNRVKGVPN